MILQIVKNYHRIRFHTPHFYEFFTVFMSFAPQDRKQSHGISTPTVAILYDLGGCYVIIQSLQGECGQRHRPDLLNLLRPLRVSPCRFLYAFTREHTTNLYGLKCG